MQVLRIVLLYRIMYWPVKVYAILMFKEQPRDMMSLNTEDVSMSLFSLLGRDGLT